MNADDQQRRAMLADYLMDHAHGDERIADLLWHSVGRVMLKDRRQVVQLHVAMDESDMVSHIVDWLKVAVSENARWLAKTDEHGRPKKLLKFGTLAAIHAEADRWMRRTLLGQQKALTEGDEELHFDLGEGWSMVRLLTPAALDRESSLMQHCIGQGSYDEGLRMEGILFLSLRDPGGMPHVTLEIDRDEIIQFQGKQNKRPIAKYVMRCLPYFQANHLSRLPRDIITDRDGTLYSIYELPDVLRVNGQIRIHNTTEQLRLPQVIEAKGSVVLSGKPFANVPTRITAGCDLCIHHSALSSLPETVDVKRDISLEDSIISELPEGLTVEGQLILRESAITQLPRGLRVRGTLDLSYTAVDKLPEDLKCGSIDISHTSIERFNTEAFLDNEDPALSRTLRAHASGLLEIAGTPHFTSLNLNEAAIRTLPHGLAVTQNLDISRSSICEISSEMRIGSLTAIGCSLRIDVTNIDGPVSLNGSSVLLGEKFTCGSKIYLDGATVKGASRIEASAITVGNGPMPTATLAAANVDFTARTELRIEGDVVARSITVRSAVEYLGERLWVETVRVERYGVEASSVTLDEAREMLLREGSLRSALKESISLIRGPTGSGKSSTLMNAIARVAQGNGRNRIVIEDPIEYTFPEMRIVRPRVQEGGNRRLPLFIQPEDAPPGVRILRED